MIQMHPILEPLVLASLGSEQYGESTEGYVVMDGAAYLGHILYRVENNVTQVLACALPDDHALVDGAVRACVAAGENRGAAQFQICADEGALAEWHDAICPGQTLVDNGRLFHACEACEQ